VTNAIGTVAKNIDRNSRATDVVAGDMKPPWDFNKRSGNLTISHFNRSVTPGGLTLFSRALSVASELPKSLSDLNSPVGISNRLLRTQSRQFSTIEAESPSGAPAQSVIGTSSEHYNATGIFAGSLR